MTAIAVAALAVPGACAAETLAITGAVSDNYKASYNADPSAAERRTWLSFDSISAAGTTWAPSRPASITFTGATSIAVASADGRSGTLALRLTRGTLSIPQFRSDPEGRWGPFGASADPGTLEGTPVLVHLTLATGAATLATGDVEYRWLAAFANAEPGHLEHNGPGGRWYVGGRGIRTDWEPDPGTPTVDIASLPLVVARTPPRIARVALPASSPRRVVRMSLGLRRGSAPITRVRVSIGARAFGRWIPLAPRYSLELPAVNGRVRVRVQVRGADGATSAIAARAVSCSCG